MLFDIAVHISVTLTLNISLIFIYLVWLAGFLINVWIYIPILICLYDLNTSKCCVGSNLNLTIFTLMAGLIWSFCMINLGGFIGASYKDYTINRFLPSSSQLKWIVKTISRAIFCLHFVALYSQYLAKGRHIRRTVWKEVKTMTCNL